MIPRRGGCKEIDFGRYIAPENDNSSHLFIDETGKELCSLQTARKGEPISDGSGAFACQTYGNKTTEFHYYSTELVTFQCEAPVTKTLIQNGIIEIRKEKEYNQEGLEINYEPNFYSVVGGAFAA